MEIVWYGHACFRLRSRPATVVADPYGKGAGYVLPRVRADVVTVSHDNPLHNHSSGISGDPYVVRGPGEYEVKDVFITGIRTYCDNKKGAARGFNTVYLIEMDDLRICHLGSIAHLPTQAQAEELSDVDVLLVPVGGQTCLSAAQATEVISMLEPRIVVPMLYKTALGTLELAPLSRFIKAMGVKMPNAAESLQVQARKTPDETQVVILEPRQ
jgi:L-ascorbate metabolism protein UlaG (beta-lactamase superfamily)